jgi:hypothetical protein
MLKDLNNGAGDKPYDVIVHCASRVVAQVYEFFKWLHRHQSTNPMYRVESGVVTQVVGGQYDVAYAGYSPQVKSPFGTFAGGKLLGARGIWLGDMTAADVQNFNLTDSNGDPQIPPNYQNFEVTALAVGDRVAVFILDGDGGNIDMDMCGGCVATPAGADYLNVAGPIPDDVAAAEAVRVRDFSDDDSEQKYTYTGVDRTLNRFTGLSPVTVTAYTTDDTLYVGLIDRLATGAVESTTVKWTALRYTRVKVRHYGGKDDTIIPWEADTTFPATGRSMQATRTDNPIPN